MATGQNQNYLREIFVDILYRSQNFLGQQERRGVGTIYPYFQPVVDPHISLELTHYQLRNYMRSFASFHGINGNDDNCNVSYDTRVELVEKNFGIGGQEHGWTLTLKKFVRTGPNSSKATWWTEARIS